MVETHGGGFHYVPDQKQPPQKIENTSWRFFESLEDRRNKLALELDDSGRATPRLTTVDKLQKFLERHKSGNAVPLGGQSVDDTFSQAGLEKIKYYSQLIPDSTSATTRPDEDTLKALANAMLDESDPISKIPAAYTYFGQLLAHDLTHMRKEKNQKTEGFWVNASNHALTFDSLFGTLPAQEQSSSEWKCEAGACLGQHKDIPEQVEPSFDLPRDIHNGQPRCVDPRADSNLALAQMHVLLVRFHQKLAKSLHLNEQEAILSTKHHIQAVVLTDYLPRIIPDNIYESIMTKGRRVVAKNGVKNFHIPLEFAMAVFRFGHSMVRGVYDPWGLSWPINASIQYPEEAASLSTLFHYTHLGELKSGHLDWAWGQLWYHFAGLELKGKEDKVISAAPISTRINRELYRLNRENFPDLDVDTEHFSLPLQTLMRGVSFGLPSGQELAELVCAGNTFDIGSFLKENPRYSSIPNFGVLQNNTPLWFYTLAEAEAIGNGKLGPIAARIVMETIHAALECDPDGILGVSENNVSSLDFKSLIRKKVESNPHFTLPDIVKFTYSLN